MGRGANPGLSGTWWDRVEAVGGISTLIIDFASPKSLEPVVTGTR